MGTNPYEPPNASEVLDVTTLYPASRDTCPVCLNAVNRRDLFWHSSATCSKCGTHLTLAFPEDSKPGLGCVVVAMLCVGVVAFAFVAALRNGFASLSGLLLLIPILGVYSCYNRWFTGLPYPRSLVEMGRIPSPDQQTTGNHG